MRWPWSKKPDLPAMPPYVPPVRETEKPAPGIDVQEHDTSQMSQTGVHKAWKRLGGEKP